MLASGVAVAGPSTCPQCGAGVIPGEAFCDNCGASLLSSAPTVGAGAAPPAPGLPYGGVPPQPSYPPPAVVGAAPTLAGPAQPSAPAPVLPAQPVAPVAPVQPVAPARSALAPAQLIVHSSGARLSLPAAAQAVLGRSDPVSGFFPEVDLMPHGALEHGVGRRHVRLFIQDGQVKAEDLDSTNGTFINTVRVAPRTPQALRDGDELRLGNLLLKVVL
jgi:FHA domain